MGKPIPNEVGQAIERLILTGVIKPRDNTLDIYQSRRAEIDAALNSLLAGLITPFVSYETTGCEFDGSNMLDAFLAGVEWAAFNLET